MAYVRSNSMFKKKPKKRKEKTVEELNRIKKILCCNAMVFEVIDLAYYFGVSNIRLAIIDLLRIHS